MVSLREHCSQEQVVLVVFLWLTVGARQPGRGAVRRHKGEGTQGTHGDRDGDAVESVAASAPLPILPCTHEATSICPVVR